MKKRLLHMCSLGLVLTAASSLRAQQSVDNVLVIAEVGGQKLTVGDLQQKQAGKLLQARYQYYMNQRKALDQLIDDKLLEIEAKNLHISVDELLKTVVYKGLKDPTEDQMQVYYEGMESTESYEVVRGEILDHIRELRRDKARANFVKDLRNNAHVQILLEPPLIDVDVKNAYEQGSKTAPVTLVEFADYECPYCQKITPDLQKLEKEYAGRLAVIYKDFPLPMHHTSQKAAEAARCAGEQGKFWEYHDVLFYSKQTQVDELKAHARVLRLDGERFDKCLDDGAETANVKKDFEEAHQMGLTGTPSFFVNGHFFSGAADYTVLKEMVDMELALASSQAASHTEVSKNTPESRGAGTTSGTGRQE
jgi:predicted DsbA family dithiol-disulfide isomerase